MAAEYGININVRTKDEKLKVLQKSLTTTEKKVKSLQKELDQLSKKTGKGPGSGGPFSKDAIAKAKELTQKTKEAQIAFERYTKGLLNYEGANRKGIASTRALAERMKELAASSGITSQKFELFTQGFTKLNFSAQIKSLQRFNESAKITASTFSAMGSKNVPGVTGFSNADISTLLNFTPANTINAIERYLDTLTGVRKQLDITEKEYKDVTGRIKEMNKELEKQRTLLREPTEGKGNRRREQRSRREERDRLRATPGGRLKRLKKGDQQVRDQVLSSALIGGAFPLLFGQGLAASAGGAAGGAGGGLLGGQFGFALSLVGTQVGAQFDKLAQSATALGKALRNPIENVDVLTQKIGVVNTPFGDTIKTLNDLGLEGIAAEAVLDKFNKTFNTNKKTISKLGEESIRFENELQKLGTGLSLFVAGPLTFFLEKINSALGFQTISGLKKESQAEAVKEARAQRNQANQPGGKKTGNPFLDFFMPGIDLFREGKIRDEINVNERAAQIFEQKMNERGMGGLEGTRNFDNENMQRLIKERRDFEIFSLQKQLQIEQKSLTFRSEDLDVLKKRMDLLKIVDQIKVKELVNTKIMTAEQQRAHQFEIDKLDVQRQISEELLRQSIIMSDPMKAALIDLNKEMAKFNDMRFQAVEFSKAFGNAFQESFKGIVKGTMSVQDAFRNMFSRIADHFLDMAAQMMANQLQRSILGMFGSAFGGGASSFFIPSTPLGIADPSQFLGGPNPFLANGGTARAGSSYIVGERGPEMFTPGVTGTVTPNHELGGMGGSTNIVVNVDASGSSVEGDEENGRELGRMISVAIQSELIKQKRPGGLLT